MIKTKIITSVATSALMLATLAPMSIASAMQTDVQIGSNGAFSENGANIWQNQTTSLMQSNYSNISNSVNSNASSGGDNASFNTGGSTFVSSGPATSMVNITNRSGSNFATMPCNTCNGGGSLFVGIGGNGAFSRNGVNVTSNN